MGVRLRLGSLQTAFDRQRPLQKVQRSAHFADSAVVARHVVEGHGLPELVVLTQLLRFLQQVERTINIFFLEVVHSQNIANFAQLLA